MIMATPIVVYTAGVFDMFHVGHLNLLRAAKGLGDKLIAAVSTDEVVESYKPGQLVMPYAHRFEIVSSIKYVDVCVPQKNRDKMDAWRKLKFDILAIGDDWFGRSDYVEYEAELQSVGVRVVYVPYTDSISSTHLKAIVGHGVNVRSDRG
jgi:glycerol-3-phosphate cytidylyltransferase